MTTLPNWAEELTLRDEVLASDGSVGELQMSLGKVVYKTDAVPYAKADYWCEITEPTDSMVNIFTDVALRLWGPDGLDIVALRQFYQGMGGGKSHTLTGMWHMAHDPDVFFASDLGTKVIDAAESLGYSLAPTPVKVLALCADQFSPGKASPLFGPAKTLFERFLWGLLDGDEDRYNQYRAQGANKATIAEVLDNVRMPVVVMIDELMDYVAAGSSNDYADQLQSDEHEFINALFDACDDVDRVTVLLVMIRSDFDEEGYNPVAKEFREFVQARINRNGRPVHVSESADFLNIIRRRLFATDTETASANAAAAFSSAVDDIWKDKVFDRLPGGRNLTSVTDTLAGTYPFHPDLVALVQNEWSSTLHFQRVRSTVRIFAAALAYWVKEHADGRWVPPIIGTGDLPLNGRGVLDGIINSGIFMGNDTAVQGFTNLAGTEIISIGSSSGHALDLDKRLSESGVDLAQPRPAVRMATALYNLSLINRAQGTRGAAKEELLSAVWTPDTTFTAAEELRVRLIDIDEGLPSLEIDEPGNGRDRYWLSIKNVLNSLHKAAKTQINADSALDHAWHRAQELAGRHTGPFLVQPIEGTDTPRTPASVVSEIDQRSNRLVLLDPRTWTLYNGDHAKTKTFIEEILGTGSVTAPHAASCIVVAADKAHKDQIRKAAVDVLAWEHVSRQLASDDAEEKNKVDSSLAEARIYLDTRLLKAFKDFAYVTTGSAGAAATVHIDKFDDETHTSLRGDHVWTKLVTAGRAVEARQLNTLDLLLGQFPRALTPNEILSAFYSDPRFPLVPGTDTITAAWDGLLDGVPGGNGGWSLIDKDGVALNFTGAGQIALNRTDVTFQPTPVPEPVTPDGDDPAPDSNEADIWTTPTGGGSTGNQTPTGSPGPGPKAHREYRIRVPNSALVTTDARSQMRKLLMQLVQIVDPAQGEHKPEVMNVDITLTTTETETAVIKAAVEALNGKFDDNEPLA